MDVTERIRQHIATEPVVLFMKGTPDFPQCGFSAQTVAALQHVGAKFHAVNIFEDLELRDELKKFSNWPTYPQLHVKGELIGGCDIAMQMLQSGELKKLIEEAGAATAAAGPKDRRGSPRRSGPAAPGRRPAIRARAPFPRSA